MRGTFDIKRIVHFYIKTFVHFNIDIFGIIDRIQKTWENRSIFPSLFHFSALYKTLYNRNITVSISDISSFFRFDYSAAYI